MFLIFFLYGVEPAIPVAAAAAAPVAFASELFPTVNRSRAEEFYALPDDSRGLPESLITVGVVSTGTYFSEATEGDDFKLKSESTNIIYRVKRRAFPANRDGSITLIYAIKTGGHREMLVRTEDGSFELRDVTDCPESPPIVLARF